MAAFGSFGKFQGFSKQQNEQASDSERPRILGPTGENVVDNKVEEAVKKKTGKPIDTYEARVKPIKYAGMTLGALIHLEYANFQHDPKPLALIMNNFDTVHGNFRALNLHYVSLKAQMDIILRVLYINAGAIRNGKSLLMTWDLLKPIFKHRADYVPYRYYKPWAVKNPRYIPVNQWVNTIKNSRTILPG